MSEENGRGRGGSGSAEQMMRSCGQWCTKGAEGQRSLSGARKTLALLRTGDGGKLRPAGSRSAAVVVQLCETQGDVEENER